MLIFGFNEKTEFTRDEFHFFLDCFVRGAMKLVLPGKSKKPVYPGHKIGNQEIARLVS